MGRLLLRLFLILGIPLGAAFLTFMFLKSAILSPLIPGDKTVVLIEIAPKKTFRDVCKDIQAKGIIRHWWGLEVLARLKRMDNNLKAGEYELAPGMSPQEILAKFARQEIFTRKVTVKEGMTIYEVAKVVDAAGLLSEATFIQSATDKELMRLGGLPAEATSFEGFLYPETYFFSRPIKAKDIIWKMLTTGEQHWSEEYTKRAEELKHTRYEVLTLASIIEKETGKVEEQPLIASVFTNRLMRGMKLESDATVIYGIPNFDGNLHDGFRKIDHPFNTYLYSGLPIGGPIANPGENAIKAALYPAETDFLFFVADGTGGHKFSVEYADHKQAVENLVARTSGPASAAVTTK